MTDHQRNSEDNKRIDNSRQTEPKKRGTDVVKESSKSIIFGVFLGYLPFLLHLIFNKL